MRNVFLVSYDVADPKRLRRTYTKMCGFGAPVQYSVFRCELTPTERQLLKEALWDILNWEQDRVMLVDLGPAGARGDQCVEFWGEPLVGLPTRSAVIV
ncbi:MAG: CRISPR-associated endonuclease Cas2 [Pirellulaceae bacterium]|nr:CRISPR-associated endonuclease Cas2 [Pirellulaceae bacterium]